MRARVAAVKIDPESAAQPPRAARLTTNAVYRES